MDKNSARGRAHSIAGSILRVIAKTSIIDVALEITDLTPEELAKVKQALIVLADEHILYAQAHRDALAKWSDAEIPFAGILNDEYIKTTYSGKELIGTGLGYYKRNDLCKATHIQSGFGFGPDFSDEEVCQQYIVEIAKLPVNWHDSKEQVIAAIKGDIREQFNALNKKHEFEDAAAKAGGGRW
jgi:hypothetical protein